MEERYQQTQINYYRLSSGNFYVAKATFLSVYKVYRYIFRRNQAEVLKQNSMGRQLMQ